jgi:hypothetical protein
MPGENQATHTRALQAIPKVVLAGIPRPRRLRQPAADFHEIGRFNVRNVSQSSSANVRSGCGQAECRTSSFFGMITGERTTRPTSTTGTASVRPKRDTSSGATAERY